MKVNDGRNERILTQKVRKEGILNGRGQKYQMLQRSQELQRLNRSTTSVNCEHTGSILSVASPSGEGKGILLRETLHNLSRRSL